jgi:DHA1 family multidrug resistance protein-like MFS transporter
MQSSGSAALVSRTVDHRQSMLGHTLKWSILLCSLPLFILAFLLPIYAQDLGASASDIGGLFAIFSLAMIVVRPVVGLAIDRYGRRYFLLTGLGAYVLAMGVFALADTLLLLYVARLIQGIGAALTWIAIYTIAAELAVPGRRGEAIGEADGAGERGGVYGAIAAFGLMAWMPLRTGWIVVFMVYTVCAIIGVWLAWRRVPETKSAVPAPSPETAAAACKPSLSETLSWGLSKLLFIVFLTKASQALINPLLLIFLRDRFGLAFWQLAIAYLPAALILGFLPGRMGRLSDRIGRAPLMGIGLFISALTSCAMPSLSSLTWFVAVFALHAFGIVTATPAQKGMVADLTRRDHWGRAFGLYTFTASLGTAAGPLLGGWLYDQAGQAMPFYANAILLVVSALWTVLMLGHMKTRSRDFSFSRSLSRALRATLEMVQRFGRV